MDRCPPVCVRDELGTPQHSWRVLVLPFLGQESVYAKYKFNEPWDGLSNRPLSRESPGFKNWMRPRVFHCWKDSNSDCENTSYMAVTGEGTAWPNGDSVAFSDIASRGDTVVVVEVTNSDVKWSEPIDLSVAEVLQLIGSNHTGLDDIVLVNVLMADGSSHAFTHKEIQTEAFKKMLHIDTAPGQLKLLKPRLYP